MRWMEIVGERPACKKGIEIPHALELPEDDDSEEASALPKGRFSCAELLLLFAPRTKHADVLSAYWMRW